MLIAAFYYADTLENFFYGIWTLVDACVIYIKIHELIHLSLVSTFYYIHIYGCRKNLKYTLVLWFFYVCLFFRGLFNLKYILIYIFFSIAMLLWLLTSIHCYRLHHCIMLDAVVRAVMKEEIIFYCPCYCLKKRKKLILCTWCTYNTSLKAYNNIMNLKNVQCTVRIMILQKSFRKEIALSTAVACLWEQWYA